jgi:hypothetical protein
MSRQKAESHKPRWQKWTLLATLGGGSHGSAYSRNAALAPPAEPRATAAFARPERPSAPSATAEQASVRCFQHLGRSFIGAAPATAQRLEDGDLVLYQGSVGRSHRGVDRDQGLLAGEQVKLADRAGKELIVRDAEGAIRTPRPLKSNSVSRAGSLSVTRTVGTAPISPSGYP